jgi:hypothetical protein
MKYLLVPLALLWANSPLQAQTPAQLQAQIDVLKAQVAALAPLKALAPYVAVDLNTENGVRGPNIIFHDANVHITNGTFNTAAANGLGNLIIGYDLLDSTFLRPTVRGGSHNLVIGDNNQFRTGSTCSILSGNYQEVDGSNSAAIGGGGNRLWGSNQVAIGGGANTLVSPSSTIVGGFANWTEYGSFATLVGGKGDVDQAPYVGVLGKIPTP